MEDQIKEMKGIHNILFVHQRIPLIFTSIRYLLTFENTILKKAVNHQFTTFSSWAI